MVNKVCEVHIIQPKAVPASSAIPYKSKTFAIEIGKAPMPPFVKPTAKVPKINPIITISKEIEAVSGIEKTQT